jgi:hypothetical protein
VARESKLLLDKSDSSFMCVALKKDSPYRMTKVITNERKENYFQFVYIFLFKVMSWIPQIG